MSQPPMHPAEQKARNSLPFVRLITGYMPLWLARRLSKWAVKQVKLPATVKQEAVLADGVPCDWLTPDGSAPDRVLLYIHGGGFVYSQTALHLEMGADLAQRMGVRALLVDYRVAPEHPFPAALDDCVTVYRWLLKQGIAPQNIVIAGDSAGGNLTLTTLLSLRDGGDPLPAAAACLSPVTNFAQKRDLEGHTDLLLHPRGMKLYNLSYVADSDPSNPLISPALGDLRGLPPLLVHAGDGEILLDDARQITAKAQADGVDVRLEVYPAMWHVWQLYREVPAAEKSLADIAEFLRSHLG